MGQLENLPPLQVPFLEKVEARAGSIFSSEREVDRRLHNPVDGLAPHTQKEALNPTKRQTRQKDYSQQDHDSQQLLPIEGQQDHPKRLPVDQSAFLVVVFHEYSTRQIEAL